MFFEYALVLGSSGNQIEGIRRSLVLASLVVPNALFFWCGRLCENFIVNVPPEYRRSPRRIEIYL